MEKIILTGLVLFSVLIVFKLFSLPIRWIFKLLINTAAGFVFLFLFNYIGAFIGLALGINIINAVIIGILGIPGLILLLLVKWIFIF
jgi:inhibitor of the pro-sigma K processing machinery